MNLLLLVLFTSIDVNSAFFKSKFNQIKGRAKQYYQKNFKKDKSWHFLGQDPTLFPGTNIKYRQEHRNRWEKYYQCLREQEKTLGDHGTPVPEAILGFEGGSHKFECKVCLSPKEEVQVDSIEWYFGHTNQKFLESIVYNEHIMLSPEDKTLHVYNLKEEHSGQYVCILGDSVTVPYYLTVINGTSKLAAVHSVNAPHGPYPKQPEKIANYDLALDTEWSPWAPCNRCDKVGKRHRIGYCVVVYNNNQNEVNISKRSNKHFHKFKQAMFNESYKLEHLKKDKDVDKQEAVNITDVEINLVKIFQFGVPCRSHILPKSIQKLHQLQNRSDEVMIGYCKVPCDTNKLFEVKDKYGNVLEVANNSAGIYSMVQGLPPITPPVDRTTQYERMGETVIVICPGNLNSDSPIQWQLNAKNIIPELISEESQGRIEITLLDRIVIKKSKISDSHIYSCWQDNELAGTVRLIIEKKFKMSFNHHIMLFGMVVILATFVCVFFKAFLGRKHAKLARK